MKAAIISIGDELTLGQTVDTNSTYLSEQLAKRGITALMHITISDDRDAIIDSLKYAIPKCDLLIATGGLGPTEDDLTRFALADFMNVNLTLHKPSLQKIQAFFDKLNRPMAEQNTIQAMCPTNAAMLHNPAGTAPGIKTQINSTTCFFLPGVPHEMITMFQKHIAPTLDNQINHVILTSSIHTFGSGESTVAQQLAELMNRDRNPKLGTTVSNSIVSVRIRSEFDTVEKATTQLKQTINLVNQRLGDIVFGHDETTLQQTLSDMLKSRNQTLATAESCTAGLLAKLLTDSPGSSQYYIGGWVCYANEMKIKHLDIPPSLIESHGVVSQPVAVELAKNAAHKTNAHYALSITGIAGPTGATPEKPVGTVWIGLALRNADNSIHATATKYILHGNREMIRLRAALTALNTLRLHLLKSD